MTIEEHNWDEQKIAAKCLICRFNLSRVPCSHWLNLDVTQLRTNASERRRKPHDQVPHSLQNHSIDRNWIRDPGCDASSRRVRTFRVWHSTRLDYFGRSISATFDRMFIVFLGQCDHVINPKKARDVCTIAFPTWNHFHCLFGGICANSSQ